MKKVYIILSVLVVVFMVLSLTGTWKENEIVRESFLMDTFVSIKIFSNETEAAEQAINDALALMSQYDRMLSRYAALEESLVRKINQGPSSHVFLLDKDIEPIFQTAKAVADASGGAFDITIGSAVDMWKQSEIDGTEPSEEDLAAALEAIDYQRIKIEGASLSKTRSDTVIDLGGIAKGAIVEIAADYIRSQGFTSAIINGGGNIQAIGSHKKNQPFRIGITDPHTATETLGYVDVIDQAVVTAGIYQRFYRIDGVDFHHILSPSTAKPAHTDLLSATIVTKSSRVADALSTACVVLGQEKALELIESYPHLEGILVTKDQAIVLSSGMDQFTLTRGDYHVHP